MNDLIRDVQVLRKESGLEIVDRIRLWIPDAELLAVRRPDRGGDARRLGRARRRAAAREGVTAARAALAALVLAPRGARRGYGPPERAGTITSPALPEVSGPDGGDASSAAAGGC